MSNLNHTIKYYDEEKTKKRFEYWENFNRESHRIEGPARIWYDGDGRVYSEHYWINGESHRIEGPADIWYNEDGSVYREYYYINDKGYTKPDFDKHPEVLEYKKQKAFDETICEVLK